MKKPLVLLFFLYPILSFSQQQSALNAGKWADSVFKTLTEDQKIAQLMIMRLSATNGKNVTFYDKEVKEAILKYNIGGVCLFQGGRFETGQHGE